MAVQYNNIYNILELIIQFNREYFYYQKIIRAGRMHLSLTPQELYTILMRSVRALTEFYRYIRIEEMRQNPHLEEPETILGHEDLGTLKIIMIHAEKCRKSNLSARCVT